VTAFGIKSYKDIAIVYMFAIVTGFVSWAALIAVFCSVWIKRIVPW
jgi:hypothetical protein